MKNEFIAPDFAGFYESIYTSAYDNTEYNLKEDFGTDNDIAEWLVDNIEYNYRDYENRIGIYYLDTLERELKVFLPKFKCEFVEIDSPKYYNFETDKVIGVCNLEDIREDMNKYINEHFDDFKKWVYDNHSSYDGFFSFYSNDCNDWDLQGDLDCVELGSIFGFILTNEGIINDDWDLNDTTWDFACGNVIPDWNIDIDKLNNDFKFNTPITDIYELEYYKKNNEGIYIWTKDVEGQLKFDLVLS